MKHMISLSPYSEVLYSWTTDFDQFKRAYGIVMSRGMTLKLPEYFNMIRLKERIGKFNEHEKKNLELNKIIAENVGVPCIVAYIDLCNHYHPKHRDMRDKRPIILDTLPDYFINSSPRNYDIGDETSYTYTNSPNNIVLFLHYGFIIDKNIFNINKFRIEDDSFLTLHQFNLCRELNCVDSTTRDPQRVAKVRPASITYNKVNEDAINYGRIKYLKGDVDGKKVLRILNSGRILNYHNEVAAWLYYFRNINREYSFQKQILKKSIQKTQKYRKILVDLESNWKDNDEQRLLWTHNKHYELIHRLDISYKIILPNQLELALNRVIQHTNDDIMRIKAKLLA